MQVGKLEREGKVLSEAEKQQLLEEITARYETQMSPYYAAARLWVDALIDPVETRRWLSLGIEMADHNPDLPPFNPGVLQV